MAEKKLKPQHKIVVEEIAKGKSQTDAYLKAYPQVKSRKVAQVNSARLLSNAIIADAVQKRIQIALAHNGVTPEEVVGSATRQMRSSIDDVLDDDGSFSIEKARETNAVDLIKKQKETIKTFTDKDGNTEITKTVEVEMMTNQDGRKEVANYLGMAHLATNPQSLTDEELARELLRRVTENYGWEKEKAVKLIKERFPGIELE